jgi:hypothetical protein
MNRNNLISLIVLDIVVMLLAGGLLFYRYKTISSIPVTTITLTEKAPESNIESMKKTLNDTDQSKPEKDAKTEVIPSTKPAKEQQTVLPVLKTSPKPETSSKRNMHFTFKHSKAKKVQIMGDFNTWIPQFMTKSGNNIWSITIPIQPGDYAYNFVVDGKPVRDPNNNKTCNAGRGFVNSLLKVKPLIEREKKSD